MMNRNGFANERSHIYAAANPIAIRGQHPSLQSPYANHKFGIRCALLLDSLPTPLAPTLRPSRSHTAGRGIHRRRIANMHHRFLPPKFPNRLAWHNTIPSEARVTTTDKGVASLRTHLVPDGPAYLQNALPECAQSANLRDKGAACPGAAALGASILDVSSSAD